MKVDTTAVAVVVIFLDSVIVWVLAQIAIGAMFRPARVVSILAIVRTAAIILVNQGLNQRCATAL